MRPKPRDARDQKFPLSVFVRARHCMLWAGKRVPSLPAGASGTLMWIRSRCGQARTYTDALADAETYYLDLYVVSICEARESQNSLTTEGHLLDNHPRVCKHRGRHCCSVPRLMAYSLGPKAISSIKNLGTAWGRRRELQEAREEVTEASAVKPLEGTNRCVCCTAFWPASRIFLFCCKGCLFRMGHFTSNSKNGLRQNFKQGICCLHNTKRIWTTVTSLPRILFKNLDKVRKPHIVHTVMARPLFMSSSCQKFWSPKWLQRRRSLVLHYLTANCTWQTVETGPEQNRRGQTCDCTTLICRWRESVISVTVGTGNTASSLH